MEKIFKKVLWVFPFVVALNLIFAWLALDTSRLWPPLEMNLFWLGGALACALLPWLFHSWRLQLWTRRLRHPLSFRDALHITVGSDLGAAVSPTVMGGAPVRITLLLRHGLKGAQATFMAMESTVADVSFFGLTLGAALLYHLGKESALNTLTGKALANGPTLLLTALVLLAGMALMARVLKRWPRTRQAGRVVKRFFRDIGHTFRHLWRQQRRLFIWSYLLNAAAWLARYLIVFFLIRALGLRGGLAETVYLGWWVYMIMLFVPTPGAAFGAEATLFLTFRSLLPQATLGVFVMLWRVISYYAVLLGAVILFPLLGREKRTTPVKGQEAKSSPDDRPPEQV